MFQPQSTRTQAWPADTSLQSQPDTVGSYTDGCMPCVASLSDRVCAWRAGCRNSRVASFEALVGRWMKKLSPEVEQTMDVICALGCDVVSAYIKALQNGEQRPEYQSLDEVQRASLLKELQSIMSVYQGKY